MLRALLFGYGLGGRAFHAPFLTTTPGIELAGIVTSNPTRISEANADYPSVPTFATAQEALAQRDQFDFAVISTANRSHVPLALEALQAGLDVIVDKPLAVRSDEARSLLATAQQLGRRLTAYQSRRWDGDFLTIRSLFEGGRLGEIRRFESRFEHWRPVPVEKWTESADPQDGGGLLLGIGTHLVDQAMVLFGEVESVYGETRTVRPGAVVEDDVFIALRHVGGAVSHLWTSVAAPNQGPRFRVLGSESSFTCWGLDPQEAALRAGGRPGGPDWGLSPDRVSGELGVPGSSVPIPILPGDIGEFWRQYEVSIRTGGPLPVDPSDSIRGLQILEAARRSWETSSVIQL